MILALLAAFSACACAVERVAPVPSLALPKAAEAPVFPAAAPAAGVVDPGAEPAAAAPAAALPAAQGLAEAVSAEPSSEQPSAAPLDAAYDNAAPRFDFAPESSLDRLRYYASIPVTWAHQMVHNGKGIVNVLDMIVARPVPGGLVPEGHPWTTGVSPHTGRAIWGDNVVYRTPRKPSFRGPAQYAPDEDDVILDKVGRYLAGMVAKSASTMKYPFGGPARMPPAINYIHGAVHYNAGILLFNDFAEAAFHVTDPAFRAELKRFSRETGRETILVFRERVYDAQEYAHLAGIMRTLLPWFSNTNGPVRNARNASGATDQKPGEFLIDDKVLWGNPSPYPVVNPINGNWMRDVRKLARADEQPAMLDEIARPPIERGRYFAGAYRGTRTRALGPERWLAEATFRRLKLRGDQGNLFFVDQTQFKKGAAPAAARIERGLATDARVDVAIVGAGPAGLAAAQQLKERGVDALVLEKADDVGGSWQRMPTNLKLLTPWALNKLRGTPRELDVRERRPTAARFALYLRQFAAAHGLRVAVRTAVESIARGDDGAYELRTSEGRAVRASVVVSAAGYFSAPDMPDLPGAQESPIPRLHAAEYRDPAQIEHLAGGRGKRILVVGGRLSAGQILDELQKTGFAVSVSARSPIEFLAGGWRGRLAERLLPLFERLRGALGFSRARPIAMEGGRARRLIESGRVPVLGAIERLDGRDVVFANGRRQSFDLIVYATGYRPASGFLPASAVDAATGQPRRRGMESAALPNVFFLGLDGLRDARSRLLRGIRDDAAALAEQVAARVRLLAAPAVVRREGAASWPARVELVAGREVLVNDLSGYAVDADGDFRMRSPLDLSKEVLLAFSPNKLHAFLLAGGVEHHGTLLLRKVRSRPADGTLRAAAFVRLKNPPPGTAEAIAAYMASLEGRSTLTCVNGACRALEAAGIRIAGRPADEFLTLRPTLEAVLEGGITGPDGRPIELEVYKTKPVALQQLLETMGESDRSFGITFLPLLVLALPFALGRAAWPALRRATTAPRKR